MLAGDHQGTSPRAPDRKPLGLDGERDGIRVQGYVPHMREAVFLGSDLGSSCALNELLPWYCSEIIAAAEAAG